MKRILGWGVGVVWLGLALAAFNIARNGMADGHGELGFWFSVVGTFLLIASLGAFIGTWIHTQEKTSGAAH